MYVRRYFHPVIIYFISWRMILYSLFTGLLAVATYHYLDWRWVAIPWLPVSLIGTAVAFYVGFKNNQSYDRGWEARKVWGGIVNTSRSFGAAARAFVTSDFTDEAVPQQEIHQEVCTLIYRHIAWLHALKHAMWQRTPWEHEQIASVRQRNYFRKRIDFSSFETEASACLSPDELAWIKSKRNAATQLLDRQSQHLAALRRRKLIDDFRHMELQRLITELYSEQGRTERIKNTPLPRQYSTSSAIFILIFTFLLPFGMLNEFQKIGEDFIWLLIPFNLVVSWVFSLMEYTGDYSENPFEGLINDVPIQSIVRNIEIDLKDMLGEKDLPERMKPELDVLF
ncbi:bestrophin family ion channel [Nibrella saemangeumensis]|uniref:Bestrophin family ion channel n=1 Tax=Nibrella saemangeumensis TaxID=1084526 RepID=A0ABP8NL78_9BACT